MTAPLRVCLDARLFDGQCGGIQQVVIGLASGLSALADGDEEYLFLAYAGADAWIRPYVTGPCRLLHVRAPRPGWRQALRSVPLLRPAWQWCSPLLGRCTVRIPRSDGTIERAGVDVMHFTLQSAFLTGVPSIYQPHDLLHLHHPEYFTPRVRLDRKAAYRAFCEQAEIVAVMTAWGRRDLMRHFGLPDEKVRVVPWGPVLTAYPSPTEADLAATREKYSLPGSFVYYPAQTFPHKNHIGVLEALALLRDRYGVVVPFVSSGHRTDFYSRVARRVRELDLEHQTRFLGFVTPLEVGSLYRLCRCMVFPSKFEGWGLPVTEAFHAGVPVACSNVTSLPDLAGEAALLFDPNRPDEIAYGVGRLWASQELRHRLVAHGRRRVAELSWEKTARLFRAHYRRMAGRTLGEKDRALIGAPPPV